MPGTQLKRPGLNLTLGQKVLFLVGIPVMCELAIGGVLYVSLKRAEYESWRAWHRMTVISAFDSVRKNAVECGAMLYLYGLTSSQTVLTNSHKLSEALPKQIRNLKIMVKDSPNASNFFKRLDKIADTATGIFTRIEELTSERTSEYNDQAAEDLSKAIANLNSELRAALAEQEKLEKIDPEAEARARQMIVLCLAIGMGVNVALAVALTLYFNRDTLSRVKTMVENASRLSASKQLLPAVGGGDEIAHLDKTFHEMADALAVAARRKQELMAMVSHDLRSPLTSMCASLTMLDEGVYGDLTPRAKKEITVAERNAQRLIALINDLLDIEKLEAGQMAMELKSADVISALESARDTVQGLAAAKNVRIEVTPTDAKMWADPDRVVQVVVNLLSNAIKYSPADSFVTVYAKLSDDGGDVTINVADQGRGIPANMIESVFDRFTQVEIADAKVRGGTGLGLAICKAIVETHGGKIGVVSERGSTFYFSLPTSERKPLR